jgi:hypothetical protein
VSLRHRLAALVVAGTLAGGALGVASPAAAQVRPASPPPGNPSELCGPDDIYVRVTTWRDQTIVRALPIATHGGCASSWATGQMSVAAVVGQCKRLEEGQLRPDGVFVQITYPHVFYDRWEAKNRSDCVKILHGLATGQLDADVLPFPF